MLKKLSVLIALTLALAASGFAQNSNAKTTRKQSTTTRTTTTTQKTPATTDAQTPPPAPATEQTTTTQTRARTTTRTNAKPRESNEPGAAEVRATFDALVRGISKADVNAVMSIYWNSPKLILFNNNGTVTRGWEQVKANRASSYPNLKNVKLDVRDVRVQMLGRDAALVTCLWTQSQEFQGTPETATGRLSLVFRQIGGAWKIIHTHTSPDAPDPSRIPASERVEPTPQPPVKP